MNPSTTYLEDLRAGQSGPDCTYTGLSRTDFVKYAGASGDFNPMHHDDDFAKAVGYPSVFGHGMLTAGLLAHYLTDWLGAGTLRRYTVRFSKQVYPGDDLRIEATVDEVADDTVSLRCAVVTARGDTVLQAWATAAPARRT